MGEIKKVVSGDVTVMKAFGTIIFKELMSVLQEFYTHNPTKFVVWDLTEASAAQIRSTDIDQIINFVSQYSRLRIGGKTAIVAPRDLEFGIGRMIDISAEIKEFQFKIEVFRKHLDAANWFGMDELPVID